MRRHEQPLIEGLIATGIAAQLTPNSRSRQTVADTFDQIFAAHKISTGGRQSAAGILDQTAHADIGTVVRRLFFAYKLAIAVIHHQTSLRIFGMKHVGKRLNIFGHQTWPGGITAAALYRHDADLRFHGCPNGFQIQFALRRHCNLGVANAHHLQRSRRTATNADHILQRVIRRSRSVHQFITRLEQTKQTH